MHQPAYPPPTPPRPPRWGRFTAWTMVAAAAAFAIGGGVAHLAKDGGGSSIASPAACKKAMTARFQEAMEDPGASPKPEPPACVGLDEATLEKIGGEVMSEYTASPEAEKAFEEQWRKALESATATP